MSVWLAMGLDIHSKRGCGLKFLDPFGFQGQSGEAVIVAWTVNGHDGDVIRTVVGLAEMSGHWLIPGMFSVGTVLQKAGF